MRTTFFGHKVEVNAQDRNLEVLLITTATYIVIRNCPTSRHHSNQPRGKQHYIIKQLLVY